MARHMRRENRSRQTKKPKARGARVVDEPKQLDESLGEKGKMVQRSVKLKLRSVLNDVDPDTGDTLPKKDLLAKFEECGRLSSRLSHLGGKKLLEALMMYCECPDREDRYGSIGDLLQDQTFYRQLLFAHHNQDIYGTRPGAKEKPSKLVKDVRRKFSGPAPFEPMPDRWPESSILDNKAKEHLTNTTNHFELNLEVYQERTIKSFLRERLGKAPSALVEKILRKIVGEKVDLSKHWDPADASLYDFIDKHRAQLGIPSLEEEEARQNNESVMLDDFYCKKSRDKKDTRPWTKDNLDIVVPYFYWMVKGLENDAFGEKVKLARLCPRYKIKGHHMIVDSTTFAKILRSVGDLAKADRTSSSTFKNARVKEQYWIRWVCFQRFEVNSEIVFKSFHFYFVTDGKSVSLVFDVERVIMDAAIPRDHDKFLEHHSDPNSLSRTDYQLGGADPGVVNVLTVAIKVQNGDFGDFRYISLKLGHYRNNSLILAGQRADLKQRERAARKDYHDACTQFSSKTVNRLQLEQFEELMHHEGEDGTSLYDRIWEEMLRPRYREWKFRVYRASQRTLAKHVASLRGEGGAPLILLYGNGSWGRPKGNPAAPNRRMLEECKRQHVVVMVDEWMSSQTCPVCSSRFPKTVKKPAPGEKFDFRRHSVRGLLYCRKCKSCCYWDRDIVGARCIFIIGTTPEELLPDMLRREFADDRPKRGYHRLHV